MRLDLTSDQTAVLSDLVSQLINKCVLNNDAQDLVNMMAHKCYVSMSKKRTRTNNKFSVVCKLSFHNTEGSYRYHSYHSGKIQMIKAIREATGMGLKESKEVSEGVNHIKGRTRAQADALVNDITNAISCMTLPDELTVDDMMSQISIVPE